MVSHLILWGIAFLFLWLAEVGYFKIATRYHIVDKPNERSSHARLIIRGGGIIFPVSIIAWHFSSSFLLPWFVLAMVVAAVVSFVDDIVSVNFLVRIFFQLAAILLIFYQESIFHYPLPVVGAALIICVGTLNAFNFMDGINGITGIYSLVTLLTLLVIQRQIPFTEISLLIGVMMSLLVFLFFNFRKMARCFAGDVGSVTIALVIVFFVIQLIITTSYFGWIFLLLIYGLDSVITIFFRLMRRENIFEAHRTHLFQYLSNECGYDHRMVSVGYGLCQLAFNVLLIYSFETSNVVVLLLSVFLFALMYLAVRYRVIRKVSVK